MGLRSYIAQATNVPKYHETPRGVFFSRPYIIRCHYIYLEPKWPILSIKWKVNPLKKKSNWFQVYILHQPSFSLNGLLGPVFFLFAPLFIPEANSTMSQNVHLIPYPSIPRGPDSHLFHWWWENPPNSVAQTPKLRFGFWLLTPKRPKHLRR